MVGQAPHPGDLVDSKELGQLETEHGGPAPPRRDLETKCGVRASVSGPIHRLFLTPVQAGPGHWDPGRAVRARARVGGSCLPVLIPRDPRPARSFPFPAPAPEGLLSFRAGPPECTVLPSPRAAWVSSPSPWIRVPRPRFLSPEKPESGRSMQSAPTHAPAPHRSAPWPTEPGLSTED